MAKTTLSSKGQVVVPLELRRRLGLSPGDSLTCELDGNRLILVPDRRHEANRRMGKDGLPILSAPDGAPEMTPELVKDLLSD